MDKWARAMLSNVARVPEMWLVYMEMCCSVNYTPDFKDFVKKKKDGKTHTIFLRVEMVFQISWAKKNLILILQFLNFISRGYLKV